MSLSKENTLGIALILGSVTATTPLAVDMYLPAFPAIADSLGAAKSDVQLTLTSFFIGLAIGQLIYGAVADRIGRKKPLIGGLILASVASLLCATANTVDQLIALRFLQALGVCAGAVVARAMVRDMFTPKEGARFYSLLMAIMGVAPILAPLGGSLVVALGSWEWIFGIISAFGFITVAAVALLLPETHEGNPGVRFSRVFHIYGSILMNRTFVKYALAGGIANAGLFAYIAGASFVLQVHYDMSPGLFAIAFGANAFGLIGLTQVNRYLLKRHSFAAILRVGFTVLLTTGLALLTAGLLSAPLWVFLLVLFLFLSTLGMVMPNSTAGAMATEDMRAGSASALSGSLTFSAAFVSSGAVSATEPTTPLSLAVVMSSCAFLAFLLSRIPEGEKKISDS